MATGSTARRDAVTESIWELISPEGLALSHVATEAEIAAAIAAMQAQIAAEYGIDALPITARRISRAVFVRAWGEEIAVAHFDRLIAQARAALRAEEER
jgi:hypothetical protein